jgi:pentatricopeptide repeat protein
VELAEKVMAKMKLKGVAPDAKAFGALVKAYARARNPEGAEAVLDRMRRYEAPSDAAGKAGGSSGGGRAGDRHGVSVGGGAGGGNTRKGSGHSDNKPLLTPGVVLYTTVVSAFSTVGDMTGARRVMAEMVAARVRPNERTFGHLVWGYGQLGDLAGITQSAQLMIDEGISLRAGGEGRQALVRACRECGLPASHADGMVESLLPRRKGGGGNRWVRSKKTGTQSGGGKSESGADAPAADAPINVGAKPSDTPRSSSEYGSSRSRSRGIAANGGSGGGNGGVAGAGNAGRNRDEGASGRGGVAGGGGWGEDRGGGNRSNGDAGQSQRRRRTGGPAMACYIAAAPTLRSVRVRAVTGTIGRGFGGGGWGSCPNFCTRVSKGGSADGLWARGAGRAAGVRRSSAALTPTTPCLLLRLRVVA